MDTTFFIDHNKWKKSFVQSQLYSIIWAKDNVYAGFKTDFKVRISYIDQWTLMKISCWTEDGTLLDTLEGFINCSQYHGKVFIPYTVKSNTHIYLIVQLPEYNISCKSDSVSVKTSLRV